MDTTKYVTLIDSYVSEQISSSEFESRYLQLFKEEKRILSVELYEVLNKLFSDVDSFWPTFSLRNKFSIDEVELRQCAIRARKDLKRLSGLER